MWDKEGKWGKKGSRKRQMKKEQERWAEEERLQLVKWWCFGLCWEIINQWDQSDNYNADDDR